MHYGKRKTRKNKMTMTNKLKLYRKLVAYYWHRWYKNSLFVIDYQQLIGRHHKNNVFQYKLIRSIRWYFSSISGKHRYIVTIRNFTFPFCWYITNDLIYGNWFFCLYSERLQDVCTYLGNVPTSIPFCWWTISQMGETSGHKQPLGTR